MASVKDRLNYQKRTNPNPLQRWLLKRFERVWLRLAKEALNGKAAAQVLDAGCGEAFDLATLRRELPQATLHGVDADATVLNYARTQGTGAHLVQADVTHLPFSDQRFDLVLCLEVLEHLPHPEEALRELARVSRGLLLLSVPHQPYFSLANFLRGKNWGTWGEDPEHRHHWRASQFPTALGGQAPWVHTKTVLYSFPWMVVLASVDRETPPADQPA